MDINKDDKCMHDLLALGDYRRALDKPYGFPSTTSTSTTSSSDNTSSNDEILRLPLLLRLLSSSRHLSNMNGNNSNNINRNGNEGNGEFFSEGNDDEQCSYVDRIVDLLEMVAASQRSETMDHLASFIAPEVCRPISKQLSSSIKRKRRLVTIPIPDQAADATNTSAAGGTNADASVGASAIDNAAGEGATGTTTTTATDNATTTTTVGPKHEVVLGKGIVIAESFPNGRRTLATSDWDDSALRFICGGRSSTRSASNGHGNGRGRGHGHGHGVKHNREDDNKSQNDDDDEDEDEDMLDGDKSKISSTIATEAQNLNKDSSNGNGNVNSNGNKRKRKRGVNNINILDRKSLEETDSLQSDACKILLEVLALVSSSLRPTQCTTQISVKPGSTNTSQSESESESESDGKPSHESENKGADKDIDMDVNVNVEKEQHPDHERETDPQSVPAKKDEDKKKSSAPAAIKLLPASILSEEAFDFSSLSTCSNSNHNDSDLSATITALMHHSPIIRHEHLSNALCRASVPQSARICQKLAANCPASSMSLIRGCINACLMVDSSSDDDDHNDIDNDSNCGDGTSTSANTIILSARESIQSIASLSQREAMNAICMLRQSCVLPDLMFEIMMDHDSDCAIALLWQGLRIHLEQRHNDECNNQNQTPRSSIRIRDTMTSALNQKIQASLFVVLNMRKDTNFASQVGIFVATRLKTISKNKNTSEVVWGQAVMIVQTLGMFVEAVGFCPGPESLSFAKSSLESITGLSQKAYELVTEKQISSDDDADKNIDDDGLHATSPCDEFVKSAVASCITICLHSFLHSKLVENDLASFEKCFNPHHIWYISLSTKSFVCRIALLIAQHEIHSLKKLLLATLLNNENAIPSSCGNNVSKMTGFCEWAICLLPSSHSSVNWKDIRAMITMGQSNIVGTVEFENMMRSSFDDLDKCNAIYEDEGALRLIETSIARLERTPSPRIPLVLPISIQRKCSLFSKNINRTDSKEWRQLVLHLVYAFMFIEKEPFSPFALNPRSLQLSIIIKFICELSPNVLTEEVLRAIDRSCPELLDQSLDRLPRIQEGTNLQDNNCKHFQPNDVANVVRSYSSTKESSPSFGRRAIERLFLSSRALYSSTDVDVEVARELLASVDTSFHYLSYSTLCTDPLVLLKCSLKVWYNEELRRLLLSILNRALVANEILVDAKNSESSTATECLASRDALIVRAFLFLLSSSCSGDETINEMENDGFFCPIMMSMTRFFVSKHPGLSASIIKQGLPESTLDWFIQNIPEVFFDAQELSTMLESRSLNIVEKLRIADGGLRVAITNGKCDNTSQRLIYNALSVLVSSFYFVIGPVGVPVNVLCDDQEQDITKKCRDHLFRMLIALKDIDHKQKNMRGEATLALSKLASLCKSDGATRDLRDVALIKRKQLLEKVWGLITTVNEVFGGGIQL